MTSDKRNIEIIADASRKLTTVYEIINEYGRTGNTSVHTELVKALLEPTRRALVIEEETE